MDTDRGALPQKRAQPWDLLDRKAQAEEVWRVLIAVSAAPVLFLFFILSLMPILAGMESGPGLQLIYLLPIWLGFAVILSFLAKAYMRVNRHERFHLTKPPPAVPTARTMEAGWLRAFRSQDAPYLEPQRLIIEGKLSGILRVEFLLSSALFVLSPVCDSGDGMIETFVYVLLMVMWHFSLALLVFRLWDPGGRLREVVVEDRNIRSVECRGPLMILHCHEPLAFHLKGIRIHVLEPYRDQFFMAFAEAFPGRLPHEYEAATEQLRTRHEAQNEYIPSC